MNNETDTREGWGEDRAAKENIVADFHFIRVAIESYNKAITDNCGPDLMAIDPSSEWLTENLDIEILSHDGKIGIWVKLEYLKGIAECLIKNRDRPIEEYVRLLNHYGFVTTGQVRLGLRS